MFGITSLILIILPIFFQIIFGRKAIAESITLEFGTISMISIILQIALTIIAFSIALTNFEAPLNDHGHAYRCGMDLVGIFMLSFFFSIILVIIIIAQYYIKKSYEE
jgi:uncharacterized membrane protein